MCAQQSITSKEGKLFCKLLVYFGIRLSFVSSLYYGDQLNDVTAGSTNFIYDHFGWFYMFIIMAMIIFCLFLMFSRFGNIKLGKDDDEPDFSYPAWFAMLFSAGMGIGLVFFTTAEPIS